MFTPAWLCNQQINLVDNQWFGRDNVFNSTGDHQWCATAEKIPFPTESGLTWQDYIDDTRLEITCGEAPYLVSRYDATTGDHIPLAQRIGLLDRKMRIVRENTTTANEWLAWSQRAFESIYGFEYQGDSLLLARENLLLSYIDYYRERFSHMPGLAPLRSIAHIISWNIWQMDGLKFVVPGSCNQQGDGQICLFDFGGKQPFESFVKNDSLLHTGIYCLIKDWRTGEITKFVSLINHM